MGIRSAFRRLLLVAVTAGSAGWMVAADVRYTVTDLGLKTEAKQINAAGDVAGTISGPNGKFRAFLYSQGQLQILDTPGGSFSVATGLTDDGTVVGNSQTTELGPNGRPVNRPFIYAEGVMRELTVTGLEAGVHLAEVSAINGAGVMAGLTDQRPRRLAVISQGHATVVSTPAEFTQPEYINGLEIKGSNAAGQVIGMMHSFQMKATGPHSSEETNTRRHGFLCTAGRIEDLGEFFPTDINATGQMIGVRRRAGGKGQAVFYDGKQFHELGVPPGFESGSSAGINAAGLIVGSGQTVVGGGFLRVDVNGHAFIHEDGRWKDLNDLVTLAGTGLTVLFNAEGINDRGQIICKAMGGDGYHAVLLTPVESATPKGGR